MRFSTFYILITALLFSLTEAKGKAIKTVDASSFAASTTVPVQALQSAAAKANTIPSLAVYPVSVGENPVQSTIYSDWTRFQTGSAIFWVADMDVDCDGLEYGCEGNPDGQPLTNWGALDAYQVPFIVIPDKFLVANPDLLPGNNVAAIICNNKIFYAILGDSNHNDPQVTGEASWLLARTCFPDEKLNGNKGHTTSDVTYIVFTGQNAVLPDTALNANYITDFGKLREMGDTLVSGLVSELEISSTIPGSGPEPNPSPSPSPSPGPGSGDDDHDEDGDGDGERPVTAGASGRSMDLLTVVLGCVVAIICQII
ncbi:hypothetical protein P175DRAFT_0498400 [Aspergillus ochraceoroseus IBT 24754]|uniref:Endo-chitosanase n=2 Tax=Aspergillus subgen. Nidulantes TaxID=2720870 RepID=A0A0F8WX25_9EURO|nr:uncharacterized protein P175DRAFT_0498400 [Aspergillus ochraceoroseus IBT 24754]KKK15912.1 hypothetical protein ARAM_002865 [Aspergillus rambellii]PTU25286.1 hypothetical protein P175DRAFT_0498400 [Aspergillus ochraceoroseus IBT 24754]